jgi:hypothetical protein
VSVNLTSGLARRDERDPLEGCVEVPVPEFVGIAFDDRGFMPMNVVGVMTMSVLVVVLVVVGPVMMIVSMLMIIIVMGVRMLAAVVTMHVRAVSLTMAMIMRGHNLLANYSFGTVEENAYSVGLGR